ncbi:class II fumarate hydratase [Limobrevibacterium gyesilva]|uniref:Fumarate hydratase class II n=1 Tax=Limobrevibacterium gyesilva TaxID=2991712 RepID=A0AA42CJR6_9PROT|nr:class II fumarate hydratase [Limobrevibacterium gyesilva]MCW3477167.1 class II fumarate hydratase [Limobrevibacterium gyesilva]
MTATRVEHDSLGPVEVPADRLWGAQTQRSIAYFSIGDELMPRELIPAYAVIKKAAALVNHQAGRLGEMQKTLIVQVCDEILAGKHLDQFPLHVWMTGSGTQFNMNANEVIANRSAQIAGEALGSKTPVHPNDHVNMAQSSNDTFPTAMHVAAAIGVKQALMPAVQALREALDAKARAWDDIVKIGRTHLQDATPLTLGQEFSGYAAMLGDNLDRLEDALRGVYRLALGGTAVGTGINAQPGFDRAAAAEIARLTGLAFVTAPNKFAAQGAHDDLVQLSATLKTLAVSLYKIANDIRLLSCGPRAGIAELYLPENEPGSSIMPGKVNPTQCEALTMIAAQVMANDAAVALGGAGGHLEMNVYKPLMIFNVMKSVRILADGCTNFRRFLVEGMEPDRKRIAGFVERSLMLVTALAPVIGYDKASQTAHYAMAHDLSLREAALKLGVVSADEFDRVVDPRKMTQPYVAEG